MRVERDDQLRLRHPRPDTEIDSVAAHHPAQEQIEPLAGTASRRTGKEVTDACALRHAPVRALDVEGEGARREAVESGPDIRIGSGQSFGEERLNGLVAFEHLPKNPEQRDQVDAAGPAVHHRSQFRRRVRRIELANERRRVRAHDPEERADRVEDARDASERKTRGAEGSDLAIVPARERPDEMNRVGRRLVAVVRVVQPFQA